ncbi:MAG: HRDC domain-containing protein [Planctomycetota bacterium]
MRVKLFTFRYSATLGGFDEEPLQRFLCDKEVVAFREHFYAVNDVPHITCIVTWQDAVVPTEVLQAARQEPAPRRSKRGDRPDPTAGFDERDRALFNTLREWRLQKARDEGVPPYVVLTNRQLAEVVATKPDSRTALGNIPGIGTAKVERYGEEILTGLGSAPEEASASAGVAT